MTWEEIVFVFLAVLWILFTELIDRRYVHIGSKYKRELEHVQLMLLIVFVLGMHTAFASLYFIAPEGVEPKRGTSIVYSVSAIVAGFMVLQVLVFSFTKDVAMLEELRLIEMLKGVKE